MVGSYFFLHYFCPLEQSFSIEIAFIGTFVIIVPLFILFLARAIDGITGGNISVANAYLSDLSSDENRSKNFGKMAISSNLGFILGPALAGILGGTIYGEILPVHSNTNSIFGYGNCNRFSIKRIQTLIKEILVPENGTIRKVFSQECRETYSRVNTTKPRFQDVFKLRHISFLLVLYFLIFLGFNIYYATFLLMQQMI